jgi:hypothetical protein
MILDVAPQSPSNLPFLGRDMSATPSSDVILTDLLHAGVAAVSAGGGTKSNSGRQLTFAGTLTPNPGGFNATGYALYSTVHDDDPTRSVLYMLVLVDDLLDSIVAKSAHVVATLTDHSGGQFTSARSGCALTDAVGVVSRAVIVSTAPLREWRIDIGQCPEYSQAHVAASSILLAVRVCVAVIAVATVAGMTAMIYVVLAHERELHNRVSSAKLRENNRVSRSIICYFCDELRNPLHVLKSNIGLLLSRSASERNVLSTGNDGSSSVMAANPVDAINRDSGYVYSERPQISDMVT